MRDRPDLGSLARKAAVAAAAAAQPWVGAGVSASGALDAAATDAVAWVLGSCSMSIVVAAAEGERDGALPLRLLPATTPQVLVCCDPVDGSRAAASGGPRSLSAVGLFPYRARMWIDDLPDCISVFGIGSQKTDVTRFFDGSPSSIGRRVRDLVAAAEAPVGTLNRPDNIDLAKSLGGFSSGVLVTGSRHGHHPTITDGRWVAVGDTTISLVSECGVELGRVGLIEARFEATMFPSWTGLIVSRDKIQKMKGGVLAYLETYLANRDRPDTRFARELFTSHELELFRERSLSLTQVTRTLERGSFGMGEDARICLAGITGTQDDALPPSAAAIRACRVVSEGLEVDTLNFGAGVFQRLACVVKRPDQRADRTTNVPT